MIERNSPQRPSSTPGEALGEQALASITRLQAELDALRDQLARSNRLGQLGMLTAALAHETNNFLTPVRSYAQLALANPGDPRITERALRSAVEATHKVAQLAERVIGLATPNQTIQAGVCRADEAVAMAIESMMPVTKQRGIDVSNRAEPIHLAIDPLTLEQVLLNLIGNACQAMVQIQDRRQVLIESVAGDDSAKLHISDTGPGVPDEIRENLFDAFITRSDDTPSAGSGLGLSICRQLIESAGGRIELASSSEQGSCFTIELPTAS